MSVADLMQLGDHKWETPPGGYVDVGALFTQPRDLIILESEVRPLRRSDPGAASEFLGRMLGPAYKTQMPASALINRLTRMRKEIDRGEDTFERKLRYLLWLN